MVYMCFVDDSRNQKRKFWLEASSLYGTKGKGGSDSNLFIRLRCYVFCLLCHNLACVTNPGLVWMDFFRVNPGLVWMVFFRVNPGLVWMVFFKVNPGLVWFFF